ncbi:formate dehydrogenase subunit alpha [Acidihalobacter prosperus]
MRRKEINRTKTVCTYCGVGCSFEMWTRGRHILKVEPSEGPANGISSCVKGKFGWDFVNHKDRLTSPLIREEDGFREASWDEALSLIAHRFATIKKTHGPDALGFIASSKCTNEEAYLMQKLARGVIGTNNIDNCSRYCQNPATAGLFRTVAYGGDSGGIQSIEQADLVLILGSNTAESHPVLATRVKRAHKLRGQQLIVADLRKHEMAERADLFIKPRPGTDLVWISAITRYILDHGLEDSTFLQARVNGLDAFLKSLEPFTLEYAESISGIPAPVLRDLAERIAESPAVCILWAMGITQHCGGSDTSTALSNLLLITGNYGRPGTGAYPLRGHNNVQGASDFGALTTFLPGYQSVDDESARKRFGEAWGATLPDTPGLDNHDMVDAVHNGDLKSMYVIGEDMALVDSNALYVQSAFEKLDFFVVQDIFMSRTAQYADVVLPAAPSVEKTGTFTNTERRIQRLYEVMPPLGEARPDWQILTELASHMGHAWSYQGPDEIMDEAARLTPLFEGVNYNRLRDFNSLQWPVRADGTDTPILFTDQFPFPDGRARLHPVAWLEPEEMTDEHYNLHLNNGRLLEHFHEGNLTYRSQGILSQVPDSFVELSPELANKLKITDGASVRLTSRRGSIKTRVLVTERVQGNELYMPMNSSVEPINILTGSHTDRETHTPAYKELAVSLEVLQENGQSPLPSHNSRFGKPTPQNGVEVRKKWQRDDYQRPPQKLSDNGGL